MTIPLPGLSSLSDGQIFDFSSLIILPGWLVLLILPQWRMRERVVASIVFVNCLLYAITFVASIATGEQGIGGAMQSFSDMGQYDGVVKLFRDEAIILPAWVHYLAFDMVVGNYLVERNLADMQGLNQVLMAPVLFFTMMAGPMGVVLYVVIKSIMSLVGPKPTKKTM